MTSARSGTLVYRGYAMRALAAEKMSEAMVVGAGVVIPAIPEPTGQGALMDLPLIAKPQPEIPKLRGHAAFPGTGPAGETCGSCANYRTLHAGRKKTFPKCELTRPRWTGAGGSDIKKKDQACSKWEGRSRGNATPTTT